MIAQAGNAAPRGGTAAAWRFDSDALLPLTERLAQRAERILDLHAESTQLIRITASVTLTGLPSHRRETALLRIAEALLVHLISQAMHMRLQGRISLVLEATTSGQARLTVSHDGWNLEAPPVEGWLADVQALVAVEAGSIAMCRGGDGLSLITALLPREKPYPGAGH